MIGHIRFFALSPIVTPLAAARYAGKPIGRVPYRFAGPATGPVLLLLHQTPWSMCESADIPACLAAAELVGKLR